MDKKIIDPDNGSNMERKRRRLEQDGDSGKIPAVNLDSSVTFPESGWQCSLKQLPTVSFASLYNHFIEKSVLVAGSQSMDVAVSTSPVDAESSSRGSGSHSDVFSSFKGVDKGYKFFKDGHVQKIELVTQENFSFVRCNVLPSMRKDAIYKCKLCLRPDGMVNLALCTCTAGLGGVCNHIAALLYALEEYVRIGLREEVDDSPTSRLCRWN